MNLARLVALALESDPQKAAIVGVERDSDDDPPSRRWRLDRRDLLAEAGRWQRRFTDLGLPPGTPVGLSPSRGPNMAPIHLGALASGMVVVPLSSALTCNEMRQILDSSGAPLVVTSRGFANGKEELACIPDAAWWIEDDTEALAPGFQAPPDCGKRTPFAPIRLTDSAVALMLFTSGTTGRAKAVPLSHGNLAANLDGLAKLWGRTANDQLLHMLPAHHFHGLVLGLYGTMLCGGTIYVLPRFDARLALATISTHDINIVMGVPTMYSRLITAADPRDDLSDLRIALCGSAPLAANVWEAFRDRFGVELVERYGLTETGIVASNPPQAPRVGAVGMPVAGSQIAIRQDDQYRLWDGSGAIARGEICVRGASVMSGYIGDDEATAAAVQNGWFHTGDLGYVDDDGYVCIDGRLKDLIIVGGSNVIPGEVERALNDVRGVQEVVAAGLPDDDLGEIVAAFVVSAQVQTNTQELETGLRAAAETSLAAYKRPRRYVFVLEIPRNAMGKVDRPGLLELANRPTSLAS